MCAILFVVASFRPIDVSGWEIASQPPRWFVAAMGVYLTAVYLPLYIAHGFTRRESARQLAVAAAGTVVLLAALMTLGYAIERVVYRRAGWPQVLLQSHLFDHPNDDPLILLEFLLLFTVASPQAPSLAPRSTGTPPTRCSPCLWVSP